MLLGTLTNPRRKRITAAVAPTLTLQTVSLPTLVVLDGWHSSGQYERYQRLQVLTGTSVNIGFHGDDLGGPGVRTLLADVYTLLVDDEPHGTNNAFTNLGGQPAHSRSSFTLNLSDIDEGWHKFGIECHPSEQCPVHWMYVKRGVGAVPAQALVPVETGGWDVGHRERPHHYGLIPVTGTPTPKPLVARTCPEFSTAVARSTLFRENICPVREGNVFRINTNPDGVLSTFNKQNYFFSDLIKKYPPVALLDGPRGVGSYMFGTHIRVDRHGGAYALDPWRVVRISPEGVIKTRCGYRHPSRATYWENQVTGMQNLELLGDWSGIPADRRGFHETWGLAFDEDSLVLDPDDPPIGGEQPHLAGPRLFVSDSQNNRVLLLTFSRNSFDDEPVVTEFLTGMSDPWDIVWVAGILYVSERFAHRIDAYNAVTGAFIRTVVSGAALSHVDATRGVVLNTGVTLAQVQAEDVVSPEGLFHQDGWLYYGSVAMQQVKRINLLSEAIEVVCLPYVDGNSNFIKIALSDGTFGPRGTVFSWTWSIDNFGMPEAHLPGGTKWVYSTSSVGAPPRGKGGMWDSIGYASAGGVAMGRLLTSASQEGLVQISQALVGDVVFNQSLFTQGKNEYEDKGHHLIHGDLGFGYHGYPLPWGESAAMDYYLTVNGHTP